MNTKIVYSHTPPGGSVIRQSRNRESRYCCTQTHSNQLVTYFCGRFACLLRLGVCLSRWRQRCWRWRCVFVQCERACASGKNQSNQTHIYTNQPAHMRTDTHTRGELGRQRLTLPERVCERAPNTLPPELCRRKLLRSVERTYTTHTASMAHRGRSMCEDNTHTH